MIIGKRLENIRNEKNISREELGKMIGVSSIMIWNYELERKSPSMEKFVKLVTVLNVDPAYLLGIKVKVSDEDIIMKIKENKKVYEMFKNKTDEVIDILNKI